jgi:predicted O-methyltransferase YrrM
MKYNIVNCRSIFNLPKMTVKETCWKEHIPFAFFLIEILQPKIFVELGVYKGGSYNAFCQAAQNMKNSTRCYGIDTWSGDDHTGYYDQSVYRQLYEYQQKNYSKFSSLLKMPFNKALSQFTDGSIDLLHIDGYHVYEAIKQDFEDWLPKMSRQGVVLMHDINYYGLDFGVWRLWDELAPRYPSFAFRHSSGLGILAVGPEVKTEFLEFLQEANRNPFYQMFFLRLGNSIADISIPSSANDVADPQPVPEIHLPDPGLSRKIISTVKQLLRKNIKKSNGHD